jgi:hypothetical protein
LRPPKAREFERAISRSGREDAGLVEDDVEVDRGVDRGDAGVERKLAGVQREDGGEGFDALRSRRWSGRGGPWWS